MIMRRRMGIMSWYPLFIIFRTTHQTFITFLYTYILKREYMNFKNILFYDNFWKFLLDMNKRREKIKVLHMIIHKTSSLNCTSFVIENQCTRYEICLFWPRYFPYFPLFNFYCITGLEQNHSSYLYCDWVSELL